jgi:hypothetical protein
MKTRSLWGWSFAVSLLLEMGGRTGLAADLVIQSFDGNGQVVFNAMAGATNYEVWSSPALTGDWMVAVGSIAPTAANALTATVSMTGSMGFYRVVAAMTGAVPHPAASLGVHGAYESDLWFAQQLAIPPGDVYDAWVSSNLTTLGAGITRINNLLIWDVVEPTNGTYNWEALRADSKLKNMFAAAHVVEPLVVFSIGERPGERNPVADPDGYARFVRAAVERYDGDGVDDVPPATGGRPVRVRWWQVGNEYPGWVGTGRSRADYCAFVRNVASAARAADPEARLVLIAQMPVDPLSTWWEQTVLDTADVIDAVDLHDWDTAANWKMRNLIAARAFLDAHGLQRIAIWTGENATHVGQARLGAILPFQTLAEQARFLVKRACWGRANGLDVFLWSLLVDRHGFGGDTNSFYNSIGLIGDGAYNSEPIPEGVASGLGARRTVYWAFKALAEYTDRTVADFAGPLPFSDDACLWGYAWRRRADAKRAMVAWSDGVLRQVEVPITTAAARIRNLAQTDESGCWTSNRVLVANGGTVSVDISDDPVLIVEE